VEELGAHGREEVAAFLEGGHVAAGDDRQLAEAARSVPPLTGASSVATPRVASCSARRRRANGSIVLMQTTMWPRPALLTIPRSPAMTDSAWAVVSTMTIVRSVPAATCSGESIDLGAALAQRPTLAGSDVVDDQREAAFDEVERHRPPHVARAR